jgi:hypothetical protein
MTTETAETIDTTSNTNEVELTGRVVRLHFCCHAELPIGSFLRVTGSTLWAPGTSAADPADSSTAMGRAEQAAFLTSQEGGGMGALYTSSIEMVTTPSTYPIWRTRKPCIVVLNPARKTVQHHYYRYLVVSPGGREGDSPEDELMVSTSQEMSGTTAVMQWEDPFGTLLKTAANTKGEQSAVSLASSVVANGQTTKADYRNLPYRTIDIDVRTGSTLELEQRMDKWASPEDPTFRAYRIREAVRLSLFHWLFLFHSF